MADPVRYSDSLTIRCQPGITELVERAARKRGTKPSEWHRQAVLTALQLDGFDPATIAPRDAGALYDSLEGQRCYACVDGNSIKFMGYHAEKPDQEGRVWLPVVHEDSEPFDIAKHFRLPPIDKIEADRVVRVFQVVPKHWEHA